MELKNQPIPQVSTLKNQRILFAALNWGMGHVSRSLSILQQLEDQNNALTIACNPQQESIFRAYLKTVRYLSLPDYPFIFNAVGFRVFDFMYSLPALIRRYHQEQQWVRNLVQQEPITYILSDHRYGFRNPKIPSIFITHQCHLPLPWFGFMAQWVHRYFLRQFNVCWILDNEDTRWAGKLSTAPNIPFYYLGNTSRFQRTSLTKKWNVLVLNGPSQFNALLIRHFQPEIENLDYVIGTHPLIPSHIPQIQDWQEADRVLREAKTVYSFCGYTTLLDVAALGCKWRTIPTPGQLEQEYLFQQKTLREGGL